jgi:Reverse transcriptase (RNA-dependent DNA polymerase)
LPGGHRDFLKFRMVHTATNLSQTSTRLILALASIFGFDVWTTDICQAYLQSAEKLKKEIFLKTDAVELGEGEFLQLVLPLYGLSESGDYWSQTLTDHHLTRIKFEQSPIDFSFFFKRIWKRLTGLSGSYVDDLLRASHPDVREYLENSIRSCFDCKESKTIGIGQQSQTFIVLDLIRPDEGFTASMRTNIARLSELAADAQFNEYHRTRATLLWICNSRPDICVFVLQCSSISSEKFTTKDIRAINDRVRYLKKTNNEVGLTFPTLDPSSLHLLVYADASFGTRGDKSSLGGYACLLADKSKRCCFLDYHSGN